MAAHAGPPGHAMGSGANPIRKVVNLLQNMKAKVEKEGDTEEKLYEKFQCYCKKNIAETDQNLKTNQEKLPPLQKTLESTVQEANQLTAQIQSAKTERQEAEEALTAATAMRQKEKADFAQSSQEQKATIDSIEQAVKALTKGMASAFLQTEAAESLRRFAFNRDGMVEADRQELLAFLQNGADYVPQSGQILGMLKHMGSETHEAMLEAREVEGKAQQEFKDLSAAKTKEIKALTVSIEEKMEQLGELKVAVVRLKSGIQEAETAVAEDQKVLQSLHSSCNKKAAAWDARVKTRGEELMAISETMKILDDDAESFRKALPPISFLQVDSTASLKERVRRSLEAVPGAKTDLILLALRGKKIGFDKVVQMIHSMKATLKKEQENEDKKKEYCKQQFDSSDDKKRSLLLQVSNKETNIDSAKDALKMMETKIQELKAGLEKLDQDVAEATEQRKKEHEEFEDVMSSNTQAQSLLKVAKERMMQFYASPSLVEVSEQKGPEEAPETFGSYAKSSQASGAVGLLTSLIGDTARQMSEAEAEEKEDQKDYEEIMQDSSKKRQSDSRSIAQKTAQKADLASDLQVLKGGRASAEKELAATKDYIHNLHDECDWLLSNFQARQDARDEELESLDRAKAVLRGADMSFLQISGRSRGFLAS